MLAVGQEQRVPYGRIPNQRCRRWWRSLEGAQVLEEGGVRLEQERRPQGSGGRSSGDPPVAQVQRMPLGRAACRSHGKPNIVRWMDELDAL